MRVAKWTKLGPSSKALISFERGIAMETVLVWSDEQIYHFNSAGRWGLAFDSASVFTCFRIAFRMRPENGPTKVQ
jgi:hypothetical protein